jgi:hypothetical protein
MACSHGRKCGDLTRLSVDVFLSNRPVRSIVFEAEIHPTSWVCVTWRASGVYGTGCCKQSYRFSYGPMACAEVTQSQGTVRKVQYVTLRRGLGRNAVVWGKRSSVGIDAGIPCLIGWEAPGWYRWMNPRGVFQGSVRNARGKLGAWGGTLDGSGRLEDGWTQESVLRVERKLLLTSRVRAWDRT